MKRTVFLTMLIGLGACKTNSDGGFSSTGSYNVNDQRQEDLTGGVEEPACP